MKNNFLSTFIFDKKGNIEIETSILFDTIQGKFYQNNAQLDISLDLVKKVEDTTIKLEQFFTQINNLPNYSYLLEAHYENKIFHIFFSTLNELELFENQYNTSNLVVDILKDIRSKG